MPRAAATLSGPLGSLVDSAAALARRAPSARIAEARAAALLPGLASRVPAPEPLEPRSVERSLAAAWGRPPARVLEEWDPEPLVVRPAAQVHRGVLDGEPVAVKVLRPGLAAAVRADLALLEALAPALARAFPRLDVGGVLAGVREAALDELDLEHEGDTQRLVGRALRDEPGLVVPRVHSELTAEGVLVTRLAEGTALDAGARPADPAATASVLVRAHLAAVRSTGLLPVDPRPGHVVEGPADVALLGLGVARPWPSERLEALLDVLRALRDADGAADLASVLHERLDVLPPDAARAAHPLLREVLGDLVTGPARLDAAALEALGRRALARARELAGLASVATPLPEDVHAFRAIGQLVATLAALGTTLDWVELAVSSW